MTAPLMPAQAPARDLRKAAAACAGVIVVSVASAYVRGLHGGFVFDDVDSVVSNPSLRQLSTALSPPPGATVSGRPVLNLTLALNHALGGVSPLGYHAVNVAIHAAAALLMMGIIRRTLATRAGGLVSGREGLLLAAGAALLWALHPIQAESVEYVIQRAESLMGLLYLLTLYCFIRHAEEGRAAVGWGAAAFLSCLLGMGTKEVMVTAPVVILLYDRTFLAGSFSAAWRMRWRLYLLLAACWLPLAVQLSRGGGRSGTAGFGSGVSSWDYFLTQLRAVVLYLRLSAWPRPLIGDYGRVLAGNPLEVAASAALVALLLGATLLLLWKRPALGFLGAWFLIILSPTTSFVPVATEIIALHRMYLPLAALAVALVLLLRACLGKGPALGLAVLACAACLGVATARRVRVYDGPREFWGDVALKAPWNAGAWNNLGLIQAAGGDHAGALQDYYHALALVPTFATAHMNLGRSLLALSRPDEALAEFKQALRFHQDDAELHHLMGKAHALRHDSAAAVSELHEAVVLDASRADIWFDLGAVMEQAGSLGPAIESYAQSVSLNPNNAGARLSLGNLLVQAGRAPEALVQYEDAARLEPGSADIHNNLGSLLAESGRLAEAKAQFAEALRLRPDYAEARDNLAHVSAMMPGGRP